MISSIKSIILIFLIGFTALFINPGALTAHSGGDGHHSHSGTLYESDRDIVPPANKKILKLLDRAIGYLGISYIYGGTTAKIGMDCSGLVMTAFRAAEIEMPRTVGPQTKTGREVELEDIQPGDLLFFYGRGFDSKKVNHVGIYLGSGDFIHSSQAEGKVVIDNFRSNRYFKERIAQIRRVIN